MNAETIRERNGQFMKTYTLQKKMIRLFCSAFIAISLLMFIIMSVIVGRINIDMSSQLCEQLVSLHLDSLNNKMLETERTQEIIASNRVIREAVQYFADSEEHNYVKELEYRRAMDSVFYMLTKNSKIKNAYIVGLDGSYFYFYKDSLQYGHNMLDEEWYQQTIEKISMNTCYVTGLHDKAYMVNNQNEECISMIIPIQIKDSYLFRADAYLVCDIDLSTVFHAEDSSESIWFAVFNEQEILYTSKPEGLNEIEEQRLLQDIDEAAGVYKTHDNVRSLLVVMDARMFGWRVAGIKELVEIRLFNKMLLLLFSGMVSITILLVIVVAKSVAKSILKPMNRLIESCNQVGKGGCTSVMEVEGSIEISYLSQTINEMLANMNNLSEQLIEEEKKLAEEKLRALQQQINPHFLNNVLQTVKALAIENETEKISRISTLLGRFLAYCVYQPYEKVELETELDYLKNYIDLQNIRYEGRIIYDITCEELIKRVMIPKLTLQPIVENAIEHGYQKNHKLVIDITAEQDIDAIHILISDNGRGMTEKQVELLKEQLQSGDVYHQECSIGIVNVNERIRRMYGTDYGIELISQEEKGTIVIIKIPDRRERMTDECSTGG